MKIYFLVALIAGFLLPGTGATALPTNTEPVFAKTLAALTAINDPLCVLNCDYGFDTCFRTSCFGKNGAAFKLCVRNCDFHRRLCVRWCR